MQILFARDPVALHAPTVLFTESQVPMLQVNLYQACDILASSLTL